MAEYKNQGDPASNLMEECAEVIQVIAKLKRFNGNWNDIPPSKMESRWTSLYNEMQDLLTAWNNLKFSEICNDVKEMCRVIQVKLNRPDLHFVHYRMENCDHLILIYSSEHKSFDDENSDYQDLMANFNKKLHEKYPEDIIVFSDAKYFPDIREHQKEFIADYL